jgi:Mrp family chromosome partitioning ATPase
MGVDGVSLIERAVQQRRSPIDIVRLAVDASSAVVRIEPTKPQVVNASAAGWIRALPSERVIGLDFAALARRRLVAPGNLRSRLALELSGIKRTIGRGETNLQPDSGDGTMLVVVTSANPGEGKSFLSLNLGLSYLFGETRPVMLADADTIGAGLSRALGLADRPGIGEEVTNGDVALDRCLLQVAGHDLWIAPAGRETGAAEWTSRDCQRLAQGLRRLAPAGSVIVVDTPPMSALPAAHFLADHADRVLFVVGAGRTRPEEIGLGLAQIVDHGRVSFVLNRALGGSDIRSSNYRYHT